MRCSFFIAGLRGYFYSEDCVCHQRIFSHSIAFPPIIWLNEYQIFTLLYLFPLVLSTSFFLLDFCMIYSYLLSNLLLLSSGSSVTWIGFVTPIKCWKVWALLGMAFGSIKVQWAIFWWLLSPCVTPPLFFLFVWFCLFFWVSVSLVAQVVHKLTVTCLSLLRAGITVSATVPRLIPSLFFES